MIFFYFRNPTYRTVNISVEENTANGTVIFQAKATDEDSGNNSILTYALLSSVYKRYFFVDASSGNVTMTGNLDRETRSEFILVIQATDGKFRTNTSLKIIVMDVNEFTPVFHPQYYRSNVSENALVGASIIQVFATDEDSKMDSRIFYNITSGNVNDTFSIDKTNGTIVLRKSLDYETMNVYELRVEASDGKFSSSANVSIQVEDINDNSPHFTRKLYSANISDAIQIGDVVMNVTALDKDSGSNGHVTYSLAESSQETNNHAHEIFTINAISGAVTTLKKLKLDAPEKEYKFSVKASDSGIPSLHSFTNVLITVEDVNDSPPVFTDCSEGEIVESTKPEQRLFRVSASDADHGSNAKITYSICNVASEKCASRKGMFQLQQNGEVRNMNELQWNCVYNITICVTDGVGLDRCSVVVRIQSETATGRQTGKSFLALLAYI